MTVLESTIAAQPRFRAGAWFVASFGTAKTLALLGPLLLARFLTPADYGAFELALSIGLLAAVVGSLGIPLVVPQLYLALARRRVEDLLAFQILAVAALSGFALLMPWGILPTGGLRLGVNLAGLFALQLALSTYCRVRQARLWSGWVDNLALVLLPVLMLGCYLASGRHVLGDLASACAAVPLLVGGAALVVFLRCRRPKFGAAYRDALGRGGPMMLNAVLMFCTASGLRLAIGRYLSLEDVGVYAFGARLCLVLVLIHQIGVTGLFARIYTLPTARADRGFAVGLAGLVGLSALLFGALLASFVGAVATLEAFGGLSLTSICLAFTFFLLLCVLGQIRLLARRGLRFARLLMALPLVTLLPLVGVF
jgi:O-antigen/teichoic acid export membrane protein